MPKHLSVFFILAFLIGSCAPATESPTPLPTVTVSPTITPSPAPSITPTITPYPGIQTQGPYLLFARDKKNLTLMDADGGGRRQIQIPNNGYLGWDLNNSVSPDGKWLVYFTGSTDKPYDLTLNLFGLEDETTLTIANLLAPGYPENLMQTTLNKDLCPNDIPDCQVGAIRSDFESAITRTTAWSPDSKTLAFAAQIDGPSSDVYLFSPENRSIRRLVNDLENVWNIEWSLNGEKVLYENFQSGNYTFTDLYIADPNIPTLQSPRPIQTEAFWGIEGWVDDNVLLIFDSGDGGAPHNLRYLNVENRQTKLIWKHELEIFTVDPELHGMIFTLEPEVIEYYQMKMDPGTYFIAVDGKQTKLSDEIYMPAENDHFANSFLAEKGNTLYAINPEGPVIQKIKDAVDFEHAPRISPNKQWLMVEIPDGLQLFSENLKLVKSWDIHKAEIIWRSDSLGLLLFMDKGMYYLSILDGEPILIEDCAPKQCTVSDYVWLP